MKTKKNIININNLNELDEKKLRNLRINLNNRLTSFKNSAKPKELAPSHKLYGLDEQECLELLQAVKRAEKNLTAAG